MIGEVPAVPVAACRGGAAAASLTELDGRRVAWFRLRIRDGEGCDFLVPISGWSDLIANGHGLAQFLQPASTIQGAILHQWIWVLRQVELAHVYRQPAGIAE